MSVKTSAYYLFSEGYTLEHLSLDWAFGGPQAIFLAMLLERMVKTASIIFRGGALGGMHFAKTCFPDTLLYSIDFCH